MNEYINNFTEMLGPVASGKLGHALIGLLILIVGLYCSQDRCWYFFENAKKS